MPSPEASRRNGAKSRGPKTAEGKRISALNAMTHGFTLKTLPLSTENAAEWQPILDEYMAYYQPEGPGETSLVRELAHIDWQKTRLSGFQTSMLEMAIQQNKDRLNREQPALNPQQHAAYAFYQATAGGDRSFELLIRYENNFRRGYVMVLDKLVRLQKQRGAVRSDDWQNEPKTPPPAPVATPPEPVPNEPKQEPAAASPVAAEPPQTSPGAVSGWRESPECCTITNCGYPHPAIRVPGNQKSSPPEDQKQTGNQTNQRLLCTQ